MLENQWTHTNANLKSVSGIQTGLFQHDDISIFGVFDHVFSPQGELIGLEESGALDHNSVQKMMIDITAAAVKPQYGMYASLIPSGEWSKNWNRAKPSNISLFRWLVSSRKSKFDILLTSFLNKDNVNIIARRDGWRYFLELGHDVSHIYTYFSRLGCDPDSEPDIIFSSADRVTEEMLDNVTLAVKIHSKKSFDKFSMAEWKIWNIMLSDSRAIVWAQDGHVFVATKGNGEMGKVIEKCKNVIEKYGMEMGDPGVLY